MKIVRNMSTAKSRKWWREAERVAAEVRTWPDWKRAGINVTTVRSKPQKAGP